MATPYAIEPIAAPPVQVPHEEEKLAIRQRVWGLDARTDGTVSFQEFSYWAEREREEEREAERKYRELQGPWSFKKMIKNRFSKGVHHEMQMLQEQQQREQAAANNALESPDIKDEKQMTTTAEVPAVTDEEWKTAARALRTASWSSIFFLITTDILGWSSCP